MTPRQRLQTIIDTYPLHYLPSGSKQDTLWLIQELDAAWAREKLMRGLLEVIAERKYSKIFPSYDIKRIVPLVRKALLKIEEPGK